MDIVRLLAHSYPYNVYDSGVIVDDLYSVMWVERYREAGEFEITGGIELRQKLPLWSLITHINTDEVMVVENHELNDDGVTDPIVTVTGRSYETFLEKRIIGSNRSLHLDGPFGALEGQMPPTIGMGAQPTMIQAVVLVQTYTAGTSFLGFECTFDDSVTLEEFGFMENQERVLKRGDTVYKQLLEILSVRNQLGIKMIRPYRRLIPGVLPTSIVAYIYLGNHVPPDGVLFSQNTGEVENADYLWSIKDWSGSAYVAGKWVDVFVGSIDPSTAYVGLFQPGMFIDATDIDQDQPEYPSGTALEWIRYAMITRGRQELAAQNQFTALSKVELSKDVVSVSEYRKDYQLGDRVAVATQYDGTHKMRVIEYVEIDDEDGTRGYPTLSFEGDGEIVFSTGG